MTNPPFRIEHDTRPWSAHVERVRFATWRIELTNGTLRQGPNGGAYIVHGGRARAYRFARKQLRKARERDRKLATRESFKVKEQS